MHEQARGEQQYGNYIGGEWTAASSDSTFESRNPADPSDVLGSFPRSGAEDVADAVEAAVQAQRSWRQLPPPARADYVRRAGRLLERASEDLAAVLSREMGKPLRDALAEVEETAAFADYAAGEGWRLGGRTLPSSAPGMFWLTWPEPLGVVGLITPWNFPLALPAWKLFPALVAGNTVVLKPASDAPLVGVELVRVFEEAGLPPGVLNLVTGSGSEAGDALVRHPEVSGVSFTGSIEQGRSIGEVCASLLKRCGLELGGNNALIVLADADIDAAAKSAADGGFSCAGQWCTATRRVIVHRDVADDFRHRLIQRARGLRIGPGKDADTDIGPVVSEGQREMVESAVAAARSDGARVLCGGGRPEDPSLSGGWYVQPTVLEVAKDAAILQEEVFGPVVSLLEAASLDEAVDAANAVPQGLSASIFTKELHSAKTAAARLQAGIVYINGPTNAEEFQVPFGGLKASGNGSREAGPLLFDEFTELKSVRVS